MKSTRRIAFAVIIFSIVGFLGCKSSSTGPSTATFTPPKLGSSFSFADTTRDSNQSVVSSGTSVQQFVQTNFAIGGMTDVSVIVNTDSTGKIDTTYARFPSSGDVQVFGFLSLSYLPPWLTFPVSSHVTQQFSRDSIIVAGSNTEYDTSTTILKFERTENLLVNGVSHEVSVVSLTLKSSGIVTDGSKTVPYLNLTVVEFSLAPTVGWLTHLKNITNIYQGKRQSTNESTLTAYALTP